MWFVGDDFRRLLFPHVHGDSLVELLGHHFHLHAQCLPACPPACLPDLPAHVHIAVLCCSALVVKRTKALLGDDAAYHAPLLLARGHVEP